MRAIFMLVLLMVSVFYAGFAISELQFLGALGRIGPGFFPQIIGVLLVALMLYSTIMEFRQSHAEEPIAIHWKPTVGVAGLSALLILACHWLGALPGMILFMILALSAFNRGRHLTNVLVGALLPIGIYALFRYPLNAALPPGMFDLPL
jgi:hypothetical protein